MNETYPQHVQNEDEIDLLALLATFYTNKLLIIGCILLFAAVAYLYVHGGKNPSMKPMRSFISNQNVRAVWVWMN